MKTVAIKDLKNWNRVSVEVRGWLYNKRSSGKIAFLIVRDGSGLLQCVITKQEQPELFALVKDLSLETALIVRGRIRLEDRSPGGVEMDPIDLEIISHPTEAYPITLKEHGVDFLLERRHLWLRSPKQAALLRVRSTVEQSCRRFLQEQNFVATDAPIITPASCEGTTTLFEINYHGEKAFLSQSGQLYLEALAMALGRVYCLGPAFRAEKSKTRRHLMEFWMLEAEAAFADFEDNLSLQENLIYRIIQEVIQYNKDDLQLLGRDISKLESVTLPFPRLSYTEAVELLQKKGREFVWGDDFGAPDESIISQEFTSPVFVHRYPTAVKAFYMKPDPEDPKVVLGADLLAPEGYGEIIGGGQRIDDAALLEQRLAEHKLPEEAFNWYLDLRRYGSVPHSGFGLGIERATAWLCGIEHIRETIPFPRTLYRLYP